MLHKEVLAKIKGLCLLIEFWKSTVSFRFEILPPVGF